MIQYIESNFAKISKTPFKMENLLQHLLILLINFVTQSKKNQKYCFERVCNSKIIIDSILAFPDIIKYFIIFIYNATSQSMKRRRAFILEKYGIQIFKKIFKIAIYEHKKIEWVEEDKRIQEKRKKLEEENIMYRSKKNKKQVRVLGDYQSDSGNEYNYEENETDNDEEGGKPKSQKSIDKNSEYSKKGSMTPKSVNKDGGTNDSNQKEDVSPKSSRKDQSSPKSSKKEAQSPTLDRRDSVSPNKKQTKSQNKLKVSQANLSSQRESTFLSIQYITAKKKLNFKSDVKEIMNLYAISELDEWFIRWFILLVKNDDVLSKEEVNPDAIFSLFPRIFNYFMSSDERKNHMHRYEFVHHKGVNSIKFVKIETKKLNMIGNEGEAEEEDDENEVQMYPSFVISVSSSQAQLLQFFSDTIQVIFEEKSSPHVDITNIIRNDLMLHLCEGFNYLVDNYEKYFYNELIIKRCF